MSEPKWSADMAERTEEPPPATPPPAPAKKREAPKTPEGWPSDLNAPTRDPTTNFNANES